MDSERGQEQRLQARRRATMKVALHLGRDKLDERRNQDVVINGFALFLHGHMEFVHC